MCSLEKRLQPIQSSSYGCPRLSITFILEQLRSKQCEDFSEEDVTYLFSLLRDCSASYHSRLLDRPCSPPTNCSSIPTQCQENREAVYIIFHFLSDDQFLVPGSTGNNEKLSFAIFSLALPSSLDTNEYYHKYIQPAVLTAGDIYIKGIDIIDKFNLFNEFLLKDMIYFGVAMLLILVAMCLYLRSFVVTIATVFDVIFTLLLAYVIYHLIGIKHFPFMNVLTGLICIAISADDVFLFFDTWQQEKLEHPDGSIELWLSQTFRHAAMSIFVTSLTTASAFFANVVSEITDIKCFGIFSGIAILCNFLFMITWVPCIIVIDEKVNRKFYQDKKCCNCYCWQSFLQQIKKINIIFEKFLPFVITKTAFVWLMVLLLLGCGGIFAVFVLPALKLPSSREFQVFQASDPIEVWDTELKYKFRYFQQGALAQMTYGLRLNAVWGLKDKDNGNYLDPSDPGKLVTDESFKITSPDAQLWLNNFCKSFKNSSMVSPMEARKPCSLTVFNAMMLLPCVHPDIYPCCNQSTAPFQEEVFAKCLPTLSNILKQHIGLIQTHGLPQYDKATGAIKAYVITVRGSQVWTPIFEKMNDFNFKLQEFIMDQSKEAPIGVKSGWVTSEGFGFYDLQRALSSGTYVAIGVSISVAFVVMLLTSLNIVITIFALLTIALTIAVTVGALVLLGWELNILESITISLAVGLSIDFTIHYGVAYRLSRSEDRIEKVKESIQRVGPSVAMAAFTTFIAGAAMMPAKVLAYTQLGLFLMLVMAMSWIYATFFFQSLCRLLGPQKTPDLKSCRQCHTQNEEQVHPNHWNPDQPSNAISQDYPSSNGLAIGNGQLKEIQTTKIHMNGTVISDSTFSSGSDSPKIVAANTKTYIKSPYQLNPAYVEDSGYM